MSREQREAGGRSRAPRTALFAAAASSLATLCVFALILGPGVGSALAADVADGTETFGISRGGGPLGWGDPGMGVEGAVAVVRPEAGWAVQPEPSGRGLLLHSPDGALAVRLSPVSEAAADAALEAAAGERLVLRETLASGLELRHVSAGAELVGVLDAGGRAVLVDAEMVRGGGPADAGSADPDAADPGSADGGLARYRPALAELLERVGAG